MRKALFWNRGEGLEVSCRLCPHRCRIKEGKTGICHVRKNNEGTLVSLVYGRAISAHSDPIEKKPLFHFLPGSSSFSIATAGCNLSCRHCQNADISQMPRTRSVIQGTDLPPAEVVRLALEGGAASISYTYTEPTVYFEYAYDTAALAARRGLKNVFVTNGYTSAEAIRYIAPVLDAANVDLKAFTEEFYRSVCGAKLAPVLESLRLYRELGVWIEVTTLVIPGLNDGEEELAAIASFIAGELGREVPWHVSAFHPAYKLTDRPRTPARTLRRACAIGREAGLRHVYEGNIPGEGEDTLCHSCSRTVISRFGFGVRENRLDQGRCPDCGTAVAGVWKG